jgi:hypothetical protein
LCGITAQNAESRLRIKFVTQGAVLEESEQALDQLSTLQMKILLEYFNAELRKVDNFKRIIIGNIRIQEDINDGVVGVVKFAT